MASTRARTHAPWSASKVHMALRCARLFHYRYVEKTREPEVMWEAMVGKAIHTAIEHTLHGILLPIAIEEGRKLLTTETEYNRYDRQVKNIPAFLGRIEEFRQRRKLNRTLVEFQLAIREDFTPTQFYSGDAFFRGVMDVGYIYDDNHLAVLDHKTGERYPNMNTAEQLEGYAVLSAAKFAYVRSIWLGIHWVADAEVVWSQSMSVSEINRDVLPKLMSSIEAAALAVHDGPRPTPASWCFGCSYRSVCDVGREVRYEPVDDDPPDPWLYDD